MDRNGRGTQEGEGDSPLPMAGGQMVDRWWSRGNEGQRAGGLATGWGGGGGGGAP